MNTTDVTTVLEWIKNIQERLIVIEKEKICLLNQLNDVRQAIAVKESIRTEPSVVRAPWPASHRQEGTSLAPG